MSFGLLFTILLPFVLILLAIPLGVLGWAGRRVGSHPVCGKCGYNLTGKPPDSSRCPECGLDLSAEHAVCTGDRQRRIVPLLLAFLMIAGGGTQFAMFGPHAWATVETHAKTLALQAQCMSHTDDPSRIIYHYYPYVAPYSPPEWTQFRVLSGTGWYLYVSSPGVIFVHERRNSRGEARLVVVQVEPLITGAGSGAYRIDSGTGDSDIFAYAIVPGTLATPPALRGNPGLGNEPRPYVHPEACLYAGQPDPADPSRFTFRVSHDGDETYGPKPDKIFDGWLGDDDVVRLKSRK